MESTTPKLAMDSPLGISRRLVLSYVIDWILIMLVDAVPPY
jgi:hypothetical protein